MGRMATLVIVGNIPQTLEAVIAHNILNARSVVEDPDGLRGETTPGVLTKVTVDGERYNEVISAWLNEPIKQPVGPGTLLRARWS